MKNLKVKRLSKDGGLTDYKKTKEELPVGCLLHCFSTGNKKSYGWVVSELDDDGHQDIIKESDYGLVKHSIDLKTTEPLSEKFGIGSYYDDNLKTCSRGDLEKLWAYFYRDRTKREADKAEKERKIDERKRFLVAKYPDLNVVDDVLDYKQAKKNLLKVLNLVFPKQKFSVKKSSYGYYTITWTDGVSKNSVKEICDNFVGYSLGEGVDYLLSDRSPFNELFGSLKSITYKRNYSDDILSLKKSIRDNIEEEKDAGDYEDSSLLAWRRFNELFSDLDIKPDATYYISIPPKGKSKELELYKIIEK